MAPPVAQTFPIAPQRRRAMVFNMLAYAVAALASAQFWRMGQGSFWIIWAAVCACLCLLVLRSYLRRPFVARTAQTGIELTSLSGKITAIGWPDISEINLDPTRRTGVITYMQGSEPAFGVVSFRMMGPEAASQFVDVVHHLRPDLATPPDTDASGAS